MVAGPNSSQGDHHGSDWHLHARRRWLVHRHHQDALAQHQSVLRPGRTSQNEKAPDLRVLAGNVEIGAAWKRTSKENTVYHSVKLDDPSFQAPIYANLVEIEGGHALVWSR